MWKSVLVTICLLAPLAHAGPAAPLDAKTITADAAPGEDEQLYSCKTRTGTVSVTLKPDTELKDLITWVMGFTCKNFVLDPRVVATNKKITLIAPNAMSAAEAYRVFLVALASINLTVVQKGAVIVIVDAPTSKAQPIPFAKASDIGTAQQLVRTVVKPSYAAPETLQTGFAALKSEAGDIQVIGAMLMVTDYANHVSEMLSLAKLIDVPGGSDGIYTIAVQHADAAKLADKISTILAIPATSPKAPAKETVATAAPSKILVDERTNTLVIASSDAGYQRVKALVDRLDIALDIEGGSSIHVYRLSAAVAEELAKTMNDAISGQQQAKATGTAPPAASNIPAAASEALGAALTGPVRVIPDKPTNSLLVVSSGRDFLAVRDVVRELDQPRRQVYIEALIMEVTLQNDTVFGTSSHAGTTVDGSGLAFGGVQSTSLSSTNIKTVGGATGLVAGIVGATLNTSALLGTSIPSYGVLFNALASPSNTNILSEPSIIALDNEQAIFKVGTTIPVRSSTTYGTGGTSALDAPQVNISHEDLLLQLKIKPHISSDDTVMLELGNDSKELAGTDALLGPSWNVRSFETRVVVRDQETVAIGGMMQEHAYHTESKVPVLGDIPLLGFFFKYTTSGKKKTNLLILLTPYIIRDQSDLAQIRERKVREHDEFVRSFQELDHMKYDPHVDYGRKRGLVEEINRSVLAVDADVAARAAIHPAPLVETGPVTYER